MTQRLFPKPSPAKPFPEAVWLKRTDRSEVGREPFFCGRDDEFHFFQSAVESLNEGMVGGGTMIFQGAPGAGKTALMLECMEAIRHHSTPDDPWVAVSIQPASLKSPIQTVRLIVRAANAESERLSDLVSGSVTGKLVEYLRVGRKLYQELSERGVGVAGFSVGGKREFDDTADSDLISELVFADSIPFLKNFHLVVFVDEAQNIPVADTTRDVMGCLHNPPRNIPLVGAFFGLSDTKEVLRQCGLPRFADQRVVNLEPLSMEDATESFRRMLNAYIAGKEEVKAAWVNAMAELSQGWPQHINRIGVAAGEVIRANEGRLDRNLLLQVLERGIERKNDYYLGRVEAASNRAWVYRQLALEADKKEGKLVGTLSYDEVDLLTETARRKQGETIEEFLANALHAGLLAPVKGIPDHYKIPIPSLGDYLRALPVADAGK